jgi:hypothetical protein
MDVVEPDAAMIETALSESGRSGVAASLKALGARKSCG